MSKRFARVVRDDKGMAVAEYAVATVAACAFGAVLIKILTGGVLKTALLGTFVKALAKAFT